jgi:hypothetical protein
MMVRRYPWRTRKDMNGEFCQARLCFSRAFFVGPAGMRAVAREWMSIRVSGYQKIRQMENRGQARGEKKGQVFVVFCIF